MKDKTNQDWPYDVKMTLSHTDGEVVQFETSYYQLKIAATRAVEKLLPLTVNEDLDWIYQQAEMDVSSDTERYTVIWYDPKTKAQQSDKEVTIK